MATTIKKLERTSARYPWKQWADGRAWRAEKGTDFKCSLSGFRSSLFSHAKRHGMKVIVAMKGNAVEFQFSKK